MALMLTNAGLWHYEVPKCVSGVCFAAHVFDVASPSIAVLPVLAVYVTFPMCRYQTNKLLNLQLHRFRATAGLVPYISL